MENNSDDSTMEERNEQTLNDVQQLQQIELELYTSLEENATNNSLTPDQQTKIINRINEISQMRINLYENLNDVYSFFQKNVNSSRNTVSEQVMAIQIVENELNEAKKRLDLLDEEKINKMRLVEINTYYGKQYNSQADVMKIIVFMCFPILILALLMNKNIIPRNIGGLIIIIIIIIGVLALVAKIIDNSNRDKMNYDEYDWYFDSSNAPVDNSPLTTTDPWASKTSTNDSCIANAIKEQTSSSSSDSSNEATTSTESFKGGNNYLPKLNYSYISK